MESPLSFRELLVRKQQELLEDVRAKQEQARADIPEQTLVWMALPPAWTLALAETCRFPTIPGTTVRETLQRIHREQLCTFIAADEELVAEDETIQGEERYIISTAARTEILQRVRLHSQKGVPYLQEEMQKIGNTIQQALKKGVEVSPPVERWSRLARHTLDRGEVAYILRDEIEFLLNKKKSGEVVGWIEAAQPIEELLGGLLTLAVRWGIRQLELFHRRNDDKRYLTRFLAQDQHIQVFKNLVHGSTEGWALHYIGDGGVGKTMLMRHITAVLAEEMKLSIARIDFDYLNPDYPLRQPGLLLDQLAAELRLQDEVVEASTSLFALFDETLVRLHEKLGTVSAGVQTFQALTQNHSFGTLIEAFAEAITELPQQPVVLLLDTCEELAKIRPDGTIPESVQATFYILEQLHQFVPGLRVVFCGRRPLAAQGFDWHYKLTDPLHQYGNENSWWNTSRPYLQLCEMRGFTSKEAENYLHTKAVIPSNLVQPVLERSLENEGSQRFIFTPPRVQAVEEEHYKPFDLALYAAWILEEPEITAEMIQNEKGDRYVERRIIARNPALKAILPIIALLGRFEREVLRAIAQIEPQPFERLYQELLQLEWIDHQPSQFFEVSPGLLPRLRLFYQQTAPDKLETARNSIATFLERYTLEHTLSKLDISYFDAALHLLRREPERAIAWWRAVEERCTRENAYAWMRPVTELLLQSIGAVTDQPAVPANAQDRLLRAAILATHASILLHTGATYELASYWQAVERELEGVPDQPEGARLRKRAIAGQIAAVYAKGLEADTLLLDRFWSIVALQNEEDIDEQLWASFVAAIEALLEYTEGAEEIETGSSQLSANVLHLMTMLADSFTSHDLLSANVLHLMTMLADSSISKDLRAFACTLAGRYLVLIKSLYGPYNPYNLFFIKRHEEAVEWFWRALRFPLSESSKPQPWLDWRAPDDIATRIRLEFIRAMYPAVLAPEEVVQAVSDGSLPMRNIDSDRLAAAVQKLQATFSYEPVDSEELWQIANLSQTYQPTCNAHKAFPPLFAAIATTIAAGGDVDAATSYLANQAKRSEQTVAFAETLEADRAYLGIVRRMRLHDEGIGLTSSLNSSPDPQDQELLRILNALDGKKSPSYFTADTLDTLKNSGDVVRAIHIFWRTSFMVEPKPEIIETLYAASPLIPRNTEQFTQVSCTLDQYEANIVSRLHGWQERFVYPEAGALREIRHHWSWREEKPAEALTLCLRIAALTDDNVLPYSPFFAEQIGKRRVIEQIGKRRAAEIALDEGELLALRLPAQALFLLNQARDWFAEVEDYGRAFFAGTCAALALTRLERRDEVREALRQIEMDYEAFRITTRVTLPAWSTVAAIADAPAGEALDGLQPQGWRPWLIRLICCMIYEKDNSRQVDRVSNLTVWLLNRYGATVGSEIVLPAELDALLTQIAIPEQSPSSAPSNFKGSVIGSVVGTHSSFIWEGIRTHIRLAIFPITELYAVEEALTRLVQVRITANVGADVSTFEMTVTGKRPYRETANELQSERRELERIIQQSLLEHSTQDDPLIVELQIDPRISGICWEGILTGMLTDKPGVSLQFRRVLPSYRRERSIPRGTIRSLVSWVNNKQQAEIARISWQDLYKSNSISYWIGESDEVREHFMFSTRNNKAEVSVLHLVGDPIETAHGVRLRSESVLFESLGERGSDLLRVGAEVTQLFPNLEFCIIQASPKERPRRTSRERIDAAYMRTLAAELFEAGVPAVVALPSLSMDNSISVLRPFAPVLQNWQSSRALFKAIQKAIQQAQLSLLRENLEEQAFDLCLYADSGFE